MNEEERSIWDENTPFCIKATKLNMIDLSSTILIWISNIKVIGMDIKNLQTLHFFDMRIRVVRQQSFYSQKLTSLQVSFT